MKISLLRSIGKDLVLVVVMDGLNRVAGKVIGLLCKFLQWSKSGGRIDETFDSQVTSTDLSTSNLGVALHDFSTSSNSRNSNSFSFRALEMPFI